MPIPPTAQVSNLMTQLFFLPPFLFSAIVFKHSDYVHSENYHPSKDTIYLIPISASLFPKKI